MTSTAGTMQQELDTHRRWSQEGKSVGVATVVSVKGSAPRGVGAKLLVSSDGEMEGSVSGGCVENDVREHALSVLSSGEPRLVSYGIADEEAFEVGLTCGGTIEVYIAPFEPTRQPDGLGAALTVVEGTDMGAKAVIDRSSGLIAGGGAWMSREVMEDAEKLMDREESLALTYGDRRILIDVIPLAPVMLIFGAGHIAQPLSVMAGGLGFKVIVADARATFATPERFPDVDELIIGWPEAVLDRVPLDSRTYIVLLSHDARFESPVFKAVRNKPIKYLGAMGSRRTHAARVERLRSHGWSDEEIDSIHGPVGIDIKAKTPEETAVSILAEVIQVRYGAGSGLSLSGTDAPIHLATES